jgi:hypothetical protein
MIMSVYKDVTKQKVDGVISSLKNLNLKEFIENVQFLRNSGQKVDGDVNKILSDINEKLMNILTN